MTTRQLKLRVTRALAYHAIAAHSIVNEFELSRHLPLSLPLRWVGNHLVPWAARSAYNDGIQNIHGVALRIPRPPDWGGGGEFHMALGTYEHAEVAFLNRRLKPGDGFVDVGSHIGYIALHAAARVGPLGTVLAFEPVRSSFELLLANAALNQCTNLEAVEAAASDSLGVAQFRRDPTSDMWGGLADHLSHADGTFTVTTTTVDAILDQRGWPTIAGLKIDVEGSEIAVLRGAEETLARNPRAFVLVELQGGLRDRTTKSLQTIAFLEQRGYEFARLHWLGGQSRIDPAALRRGLSGSPPHNLFNVLAQRR